MPCLVSSQSKSHQQRRNNYNRITKFKLLVLPCLYGTSKCLIKFNCLLKNVNKMLRYHQNNNNVKNEIECKISKYTHTVLIIKYRYSKVYGYS